MEISDRLRLAPGCGRREALRSDVCAAAPHANPLLHWPYVPLREWRQTKAPPVFLRDYQADESL